MSRPVKPRILSTFVLLTFAISAVAFAFGLGSEQDLAGVKAPPNFSRLALNRGGIVFKRLTFPAGPAFEPGSFVITNSGRGTTTLTPTVGNLTGTGAASFKIVSGSGTLAPLAPGASATVMIQFQPVKDAASVATILVSAADATRGTKSRTVHLTGVAKGPIPSPTATATATSSATPTPAPISTDKNSANAPGVIVKGTTATAYVPLGSDDNSTQGMMQVVVENAATVLPTPSLVATDRVNSCSPAASGEVVCSGQIGTVDLIPAGGGTPNIVSLGASVPGIEYEAGDCVGCGAMIDDAMNLAIVSSGLGFIPVDLLSGTVETAIPVNVAPADPNEVPGVDFGYDMVNHLILSANYQVTNPMTAATSLPHFQIINISTPANPVISELANDQTFFVSNGRTCSGNSNTDPNDAIPDTTALDSATHIAYVTFHTPQDCFGAPPNDIAMFDLSQAVFTPGSPNTWDTPSKAIQAITGTALNGIDPISVESVHHLALVSASDNNFGVLQLPSASGAGNLLSGTSITDWVNASMPNDPNAVPWVGWHQNNGLATYVSPNTGKVMGVLMNNPMTSGQFTGSTYLAIVDMDDLLNPLVTMRDAADMHKVDASVDLVTSGIVRFVEVQ
jgi:hypothetical protein